MSDDQQEALAMTTEDGLQIPDPQPWEKKAALLADAILDELLAGALPADRASRLAVRLTLRLCRDLGGTRYYWPKGGAVERAARDMAIWAEHDGTVDGPHGIRALSRNHGLSDMHIWRILSRQRELHRRKFQSDSMIPAK